MACTGSVTAGLGGMEATRASVAPLSLVAPSELLPQSTVAVTWGIQSLLN